MEQSLLNYIISTSLTQSEILERIQLLKEALSVRMFGGQISRTDLLLSRENQEWMTNLDTRLLEGITKNNLDPLIDKIAGAVKAIQPLVLFLPLEIPRPELVKLISYLRKTYGLQFMVEIKFDPNLIAGAALVWKGVYKDYSIHQRIADNRSAIIAMFQKYIK